MLFQKANSIPSSMLAVISMLIVNASAAAALRNIPILMNKNKRDYE
jgi:hypothetical protein